MRRRVVVTGMGCVTPLGTDVETMWSGCSSRRVGRRLHHVFDASNFPTKISAEVRNWDIADVGEDPRALEVPRPAHAGSPPAPPSRPSPIPACSTTPARSDAVRRLSGQRRRPAGLRLLHANDGRRPRRRRARRRQVHQGRAGDAATRSSSWSRSRTCRPATWPACSTPRGRTPTA